MKEHLLASYVIKDTALNDSLYIPPGVGQKREEGEVGEEANVIWLL
jgi:hypothetical protein